MISHTRGGIPLLCALSLGALAGCAATQPPRELVDARAAYQRAEAGQATRLSPVQLHEAQVALSSAERSFADDPDAPRARDLAYIALRRAELAESAARAAEAAQQKAKAEGDLHALQAQGIVATKSAINKTREQLAAEQRELEANRGKLAATGQALESERKARTEAEKRASEAVGKLGSATGLAIQEETRGTVINVPITSLFASNKATLLPGAQPKLDAVAEALKSQGDRTIVIEAHTDTQGTEAGNQELSQKRADAVRDYFASRGVAPTSIKAVGVGQTRPIADNGTPDGRAKNRRLEIVIQPAQGPY